MIERDKIEAERKKAYHELVDMAQTGANAREIGRRAKQLGVEVTLLDAPKANASAAEMKAFREKVAGYTGLTDPTGHPIHDMRTLGVKAGKALHEGAASKEGLDAHSPSRKMYDIGVDAAVGLQSGASFAMATMGGGGTTVNNRSHSSAATSVTVYVGGLHFEGAIDNDDFAPLLEQGVADVFERVALELGQQ